MTKKKLSYALFFLFLLFSSSYARGQKKKLQITNDIITSQYNFESKKDLNSWKDLGTPLKLSRAHFKDGNKSLLWHWRGDKSILEATPEGLSEAAGIYPGGIPEHFEPGYYPKDRYGGIKMWLYQEKPHNGEMIFQIGSDLKNAKDNPKYRFTVNLEFTGWRTVWVNFNDDAKVKKYQGSDNMTALVAYPQKRLRGGKLFIDHFTLLSFVSYKRQSDMQFQNHKRPLRGGDSYGLMKPYKKYLDTDFNNVIDSQKLAKESRLIKKRLEFLILGDNSSDWEKRGSNVQKYIQGKITRAYEIYKKLHLKEVDGFVNGAPLFASRDEQPAPEGYVFQYIAEQCIFPIALDYKLNNNSSAKEKLMLLFRYYQDQGWAAGSANGTVDHVIRFNPIASAIFLARKNLRAMNGLKSRIQMLAWHARFGNMMNIDYSKGGNTDKIRGTALAKLIGILLMDNTAKKYDLLVDFKNYMNKVASFAPGYSDTFKPDLSTYHHRGPYLSSYGISSTVTMSLIHWLLDGTSFALSDHATKTLKEVLLKQAEIAFGVDIHYGVSGRFPTQNSAIDRFLLPAFAFMALNGGAVVDEKMAKMFGYYYRISNPKALNHIFMPGLSYAGAFGTLDMMVRLHNKLNGSHIKPLNGTFVMPYASLLAYRKGEAFATVKGYNKYIWDYESARGQNNMGRYISFGTLITVQGNEKKGFLGQGFDINDGYDWAFLPGATTKALPPDKMLYFTKPGKKYKEGKHRNFSESSIASGLKQCENGIFALDLRDNVSPDKKMTLFDSTFRAKKSYFFIGNEIICLGSDIQNIDTRYNTVTTLFQHRYDEKHPTYYNGEKTVGGSNTKKHFNGGYFTDRNGIHYIVPKGQDVVFRQGVQKSLKVVRRKYEKVSNPHTKVYLNHGKSPKNGGYEYEILLNTPRNKVQSYVQNKDYEVLQKDAVAHAIYQKDSAIYAYAIYIGGKQLNGILEKTDTPIMAMFKKKKDYMLLTVADPDLNLAVWKYNMSRMPDSIVNSWPKGEVVSITMKGNWYPAKTVNNLVGIDHADGRSIIKVYCKNGKSINIPIERR